MTAELGHFALVLALCAALAMALAPLARAMAGSERALAAQRRAAAWLVALAAAACVSLMWSFLVNDFSVRYVASHSHSTLAPGYRLAALWGSHEGSMLLWVATLAGWAGLVAWRIEALPVDLALRVLAVLGGIAAGLLLFVLFTSNPFVRLLPAPIDGADLNALLQDPGMAFHPPALYLGYVGFAVPFAFAVAALWHGELKAAWLGWLRPWVLWAWALLGVGIVLGSSWAYRVLGWGGWWFWDPVENASLLPWLAGVGLLHALIAAERRGVFHRAVLLLCIGAFGLSLIGTFIVRSGTITSVHAFATDPRRGVFILGLLALSMGGALWLYAWRSGRLARAWGFSLLSRESLLLANVLVFSVATATVLLATLYPMVMEALGAGKISVGPPYFEAVMGPLLAPAVFLMGIGPLARWQGMPLPQLARRLGWCALAGMGMVVVAAVVFGHGGLAMGLGSAVGSMLGLLLGVLLGAWAIATAVALIWRQGWPRTAGRRGALVAHLGVGVFVLALTMLESTEVEKELPLHVGQTVAIGPYGIRLDELSRFDAANHGGTRATVTVLRNGQPLAVLHPESRTYRTQEMTVAAPAVDTGLWRDVYVAMGQQVGADAWAMRLQVKPMMIWVWIGFLMMSAGGVVAAWRGLHRDAQEPGVTLAPLAAAGALAPVPALKPSRDPS